ncbi:PEGA domain-containing protein, partial [Myxococcota bacterium]|nr:PEGA domain-containing protein [Myxococcota bacterium]
TLGKMGDSYILSLSLVDTKRAVVKKRFNGQAANVAVLGDTVRRGVNILFGEKKSVSGMGTLVLNTLPQGAEVLLDGKPVGTSPLVLDKLAAGDHLLVATKGDLRGRTTIYTEPGAILKTVLKLVRSMVYLELLGLPEGAQVFIDGIAIEDPSKIEVAPGTRKLEVKARFYKVLQQDVRLQSDMQNKVLVELTPLPEYRDFLQIKARKQNFTTIFGATGLASALLGGGMFYWARIYDQKVSDSRELYDNASEQSDMDKHFSDAEQFTNDAQLREQLGLGFVGVATLSLGFSLYSYITSPDVPVAETKVGVGMSSLNGGAMILMGGSY